MASTIHATIAMEVDEIHEQFTANAAREATRMPAGIRSQARGKDGNVPRGNQFVALQQRKEAKEHCSNGIALEDRASGTYAIAGTGAHQLSHIAAAECVTFALCGEQAQLLALLIRQ